MTGVAERLTADAYLAREDPRKTERHQQVCGTIYFELVAWTRASQGRGAVSLPLNVVLDEGNVLAPDVLWFDGELPLDAATHRGRRTWSSRFRHRPQARAL